MKTLTTSPITILIEYTSVVHKVKDINSLLEHAHWPTVSDISGARGQAPLWLNMHKDSLHEHYISMHVYIALAPI